MINILTLLFIIFPITINLLNLKYLYDIKNTDDCNEINSPYINIFFNYYIVELCIFLFSILLISYFIHKKININIFSIQKFFIQNKKIFELFTLLVTGILLKLIYDIGNEKKCKYKDENLRKFLFIIQILGFILISYKIINN